VFLQVSFDDQMCHSTEK